MISRYFRNTTKVEYLLRAAQIRKNKYRRMALIKHVRLIERVFVGIISHGIVDLHDESKQA